MSDLDELLASLHDHLAATEELPLEESANRLLGEAEAIAGDTAQGALTEDVARERVENVAELLAEIDGTGHEEGDQHVAAARRAADRILDQ
ncbi:hypothetical protein [Salinibaculum rarum]|uniref:hypothetical protein n=1 Tax=Salinibaculum rarum TaxID=3058903 RepID=UPI00265D7B79|nr:hypothetical protein [Salinibaculum sp. KK48]